jgi:hypothetical protein
LNHCGAYVGDAKLAGVTTMAVASVSTSHQRASRQSDHITASAEPRRISARVSR